MWSFIKRILSFGGVKIALYNIVAIWLCHYYVFTLFGIDQYKAVLNTVDFTIWFVIGYLIWSNLYFFTKKFKTWVYCDLAIVAPFVILSIFKWIMLHFKFVTDPKLLDKLNLNFINVVSNSYTVSWFVVYFPIAILAVTLYFAGKNSESTGSESSNNEEEEPKEKIRYSYQSTNQTTWVPKRSSTKKKWNELHTLLVILVVLISGFVGYFVWGSSYYQGHHHHQQEQRQNQCTCEQDPGSGYNQN